MQAYATSEAEQMNNESRIVRVETVIEHISYMLDRIDKRFEALDQKLEVKFTLLEEREATIDKKIDATINRLEQKVDTNFKWIVGMMITLFVLNGFVPQISKLIGNLITGS